MSFKDLDLRISYDSDETDILEVFYKPVLRESVTYQRLAGYFSSTTFGLAVREIVEFIERGGKIRLVTSIELTERDRAVIEEYVNGKTERFERYLLEKVDDTVEIFRDCSALMGWMLVNKIDGEAQLEIKIAVPETREGIADTLSIYHQKVGIFTDADGNRISFEGSVNETGKAWYDNIEKFKVSVSWGDGSDKKRTEIDQMTFEKFWTDTAKRTRVMDLPTAVREKFLRTRPKSAKEFEDLVSRIKKSLKSKKEVMLRDYQIDAIKKWSDNAHKGIFEMATGTGKTFAAMGCINHIAKREKRITVVIACPYTHIVEQWLTVFKKYSEEIERSWHIDGFVTEVCYAGYSDWKNRLKRKIKDVNEASIEGNYFLEKLVIFTTHNTLTSRDFMDLMRENSSPIFLIADEAHALGAESRFQNLLQKYKYRLGLTATPNRYFDDEGTIRLKDYFGGVVKEFPIGKAIREGILSPYRYIPNIVDLNDDEMSRYVELTRKIAKKLAAISDPNDQKNEISSFVEGARASIIAAAEKKYAAFEKILDNIGSLEHCLIYCHEKQLERVRHILFERGVVYHQITYREPTEKRNDILKQLDEKGYDAVVAIRCLDEGVDIPSARIGIILASTGNPRQYIQRRGRLLRRKKGKTEAVIYDVLVVPYISNPGKMILPLEKKIVQKEIDRYLDFTKFAKNRKESEEIIAGIRNIYGL